MKDLAKPVLLFMVVLTLNIFTNETTRRNGSKLTHDELNAYRRCKSTLCIARVSFCIVMKDCARCRPIPGEKCTCCEDCFRCLGRGLWKKCCDCVGLCTHFSPNNTESTQKVIPSSFGSLDKSLPTLFEALSQGSHFPIAFMTKGKKGSSRYCKVAFFDSCVTKQDCVESCGSMGSHRYRWFWNGCCQCIGHRCHDYGELRPLCKKCLAN